MFLLFTNGMNKESKISVFVVAKANMNNKFPYVRFEM